MYGTYPVRLALGCLFGRRVNCRVVCTNTFYAPLIAAVCGRTRGTRVVHLVYDLYPDVLFSAGVVKTHSPFGRTLDWLVRATIRWSDANVFLGPRLLEHAQKRFGPIKNAYVIPVSADNSRFVDSPPSPRPREWVPTLLYSGHMGAMHDVQTLIRFFREESLKDVHVRFQFFGTGAGLSRLRLEVSKRKAAARVCEFEGFLGNQEWISAMKDADVSLITMAAGAEHLVMPSKTFGALAAGQAILGICPRGSDLAELIESLGCGWAIEPGDVSGLRGALKEVVDFPERLIEKRRRSYAAGHGRFSIASAAEHWIEVLSRAEHSSEENQVARPRDPSEVDLECP